MVLCNRCTSSGATLFWFLFVSYIYRFTYLVPATLIIETLLGPLFKSLDQTAATFVDLCHEPTKVLLFSNKRFLGLSVPSLYNIVSVSPQGPKLATGCHANFDCWSVGRVEFFVALTWPHVLERTEQTCFR